MKTGRVAALLGAVILSVTGCASTAPGAHPAGSPGSRGSGAQAPAPWPTPTVDPATITNLGPNGAGPLELGMTKADAARTGAVFGLEGTEGTCGTPADGRLVGAMPADDTDLVGQLFFSKGTGKLVIIAATPGQSTAEGIGLGSSLADVKKAYPTWKGDEGVGRGADLVAVAGNKQAVYRVYIDADQVMELSVQRRVQDCT